MLFGDGGSGKTTIALHIACAIAGGYKAFDQFTTRQRPVLVISAEDSAGVLNQRMRAMCKGHDWDELRVLANVHYYALGGVALTDGQWCEKILAEIVRLDAGFVMLDPFQELVPGVDQNSAQATGPHMMTLRGFCQPTKASTVLLHHAGKAGKDKRAIDRIRGSTALYGAMRLVYLVTDSAKDGTITIECLKNNRAEKLKPFAVRRSIDADPSNRLRWLSARLDYVVTQYGDGDGAGGFILDQIDEHGRQTTTDLKDRAKGTGNSAAEISAGIKLLERDGTIDFVDGPKGAKLWGRKAPQVAGISRQPRQPEKESQIRLPGKQNGCPATSPDAAGWLPTPLGGQPPGSPVSGSGNHATRSVV
jgi:hypothetical protein